MPLSAGGVVVDFWEQAEEIGGTFWVEKRERRNFHNTNRVLNWIINRDLNWKVKDWTCVELGKMGVVHI